MKFSARQIAEALDGTTVGNPDVEVSRFSKIEEGEPDSITFLSNPKYTHYIYETKASVVLVDKEFTAEKDISPTLIVVDDAYKGIAKLLEFANGMRYNKVGVHQQAHVDESAQLGSDCFVGAFAYIGYKAKIGNNVKIYPNVYVGDEAVIGDNTILYPGCKIYDQCVVGANCTIQAGAAIGGDGFGFKPNGNDSYDKVFHMGNVVIEDNVEVGANTTVDRATIGSTILRKGVKLDNLIQIAHNVVVGENTVIAAQTGIAGSTKIGANCMIGGQVGIVGHIEIADNVKIAAQSGISASIREEDIVQGSPAMNIKDFKKSYIYFRKLPDVIERIERLERDKKDD
jgi:UDP-3-O-[3-hydroxymyristoyl] glucosamine N-acyltransferase